MDARKRHQPLRTPRLIVAEAQGSADCLRPGSDRQVANWSFIVFTVFTVFGVLLLVLLVKPARRKQGWVQSGKVSKAA
jgi:hypothetical protein